MTKENFVQGAPHLMDLLRHNTLYFPHKVALRLDGREITNIQLLGTVNSIHKQLGGDYNLDNGSLCGFKIL